MFASSRVAAVLAALAAPAALLAADPVVAPAPTPKQDPADAIAALIDRHLAADWAARGVKPASPAGDAEFVRRLYLDLIGRAPKASESRDFIDDTSPDKRKVLVEKLFSMAGHAGHLAGVTRAAWLPQTQTNIQFANAGFLFENWLRNRFRDNTPADEVVRRILTVPFTVNAQNPQFRFVQANGNDPDYNTLVGFYQANEAKAENLGSAVSRLFVGVKLECAQCHDHPFAPYTKDQFWEFAAFFAELNVQPPRPGTATPNPGSSIPNEIAIPNTDRKVTARFFDGTSPNWTKERSPRLELAEWLTRPDNPYFARNMANRMWAHFFGYGILDPIDEPGDNNQPSHPQLLEDLGKAFAAAKFDNRVLMRGIIRSKAYQLSSKMTHPSQADPRRFARMNMKGLTPSQLFDSLVSATGHREPLQFRQNQFGGFNPQPNNPRSLFVNRFSSSEKATEASTTILQALMLMNGQFITDVTSLEKGEVLGAIADVPGWDTKQRITALFLSTFARNPTPEELEKFGSYVDRGGATGDKKKALADVFWVLLNSPEFLFNH